MSRAPSRRDLRALGDKYERMLALRRAHDRARVDPSYVEPDPRRELARLAKEFPGALREIDRLSLEIVVARRDALRRAERDPSLAEPWMRAQAIFHRLMRGALVTKRWLGKRRRITAEVRAAFEHDLPHLPGGADARLFAADLDRIARPPNGRLAVVVHERLAEMLGVTAQQARALVLPDASG